MPADCMRAYIVVGPDELEAEPAKRLAHRLGFRRDRGDVGPGLRPGASPGRGESPHHPVERTGVVAGQLERHPGVRDRRVDLGPVADDALVAHESLDVALVVARDRLQVEAVERRAGTRAGGAGS